MASINLAKPHEPSEASTEPAQPDEPNRPNKPRFAWDSMNALASKMDDIHLTDANRNTLILTGIDEVYATIEQSHARLDAKLDRLLERQASRSRSRRSVSPPAKQQPPAENLEGGLGYNNGYDLGGLGMDRAGAWKGEELGNPDVRIGFRADDIGYFDPHLDEAMGKTDIVQVGHDTYYRDVHLFVGQAKAIANVKGPRLVRIGLHLCLRGVAQEWYAAELDDLQRDGMQSGHDISNWVTALTARFKQSEQAALDALLTQRYTLADVRNERSPASYVQAVVRYGRNAGLATSNQLSIAWNKLDAELQRDVPRPTIHTTVAAFITQLEDRKDM